MKRTAIFTEGLTEQLFVVSLIQSMAQDVHYTIELEKIGGGGRKSRQAYVMKIGNVVVGSDFQHYFLIVDCANDEKVITALCDQYDNLINKGYSEIIAIRDLYPQDRAAESKVFEAGRRIMPKAPVDPLYVIAIMEAEAWFIAEATHFEKIDGSLKPDAILEHTGIDVLASAETSAHPFADLNRIYGLAGKIYEKSKLGIASTITALDMREFQGDARMRAPRIGLLIDRLNNIFAPLPAC